MKTETVSFGSVSPGEVKLEISTKEVPVVHTETKTITYESSQVRQSVKARALAPVLPLEWLHAFKCHYMIFNL